MYVTADNITAVHGFTTREGGVSRGVYESLNLGVNRGDSPSDVSENYRLICRALKIPMERLVFSRQVHGNRVKAVTSGDSLGDIHKPVPYEADGLITAERNLPLIIFTADCIPILLHDPASGAIGAVHAGWRGTVMDIAGGAVRKMQSELSCSPPDIRAAIGPGIGQCCFETGDEVPPAIRRLLGKVAEPFISRRGVKFMIDLKGLNRELLIRSGVLPGHISVSPHCTMCLPQKYWSHRYTGGVRGSQASIIMLR